MRFEYVLFGIEHSPPKIIILTSKMQTRNCVCILLLVEIVSLLEFVDASTGVNKLLFAGKVRMAL